MTTTNTRDDTATDTAPRAVTVERIDLSPTSYTVRGRGDRWSVRFDRRVAVVCAALTTALAVVLLISLAVGDYSIGPAEVLRTLVGSPPDPLADFIVNGRRLPRALVAFLVGAALGASGAVFQSLSRNPLGSPDVIGFTSGASAGAVFVILVAGGSMLQVAGGAIVGGLLTATAVYLLAYKRGVQGFRLILVGIAAGAMLQSAVSYMLMRADLIEATGAQVWLTGSLNTRAWEHVVAVAIGMAVVAPVLLGLSRPMRVIEMGDDAATGLGVDAERTRVGMLIAATVLAAMAVAAAGPISFIALSAPHLARRLARAPGATVGSAALMGALLLGVSDLVAQWMLPSPLPVGVVTVSVGGLYLIWLLAREGRRHHV
ncbi:iron complex transport system permease protein [Haloactinopolyspora alba]|uniref:Iron complex transport system permease protein n=1 Tax=Haloactinopolyspora alba TaxID=648780 RepID=A0A2P8E7K2_9ACTN|nr:iron chelate uptake ABC transporter family permease subunit [Haloactinopolyspora alba]PSL05398.1 iron complex transport system permease protein [Haloactinopolyspora alba]